MTQITGVVLSYILNVQEGYLVCHWWWVWVISPPGLTVRGDVVFPWYIYKCETVWQKFLLLAVQAWVMYTPELCRGGKDLDQGAVIQAEEEVVQAKEENLALLYSPSSSSCLPTYWGIP